MSDINPYQSPSEPDDTPALSASDSWPITATAVIDTDLYVRGFQIHSHKRYKIVRLVVAMMFFIMLPCMLMRFLGVKAIIVGAIVAVAIWFLSGFTSPVKPRSIRKQLREMGKEHDKVCYEITPEYLCITTEDSTSRLPWNRFLKWKETEGLILLYRSSRYFILLPIGQFDAGVQDIVRQCLREHVRS